MTPDDSSTTVGVVVAGPRWRSTVGRRVNRVRESLPAIAQIVVAATAAYAFAHFVLGHSVPLLAATVTVSSLGLVRDARPWRVAETVMGMLVGILIAEVVLLVAGAGWWQIALAMTVTLVVARFLSPQPGFALAAVVQSLIALVLVSGVPFLRLVDGAIGGVAALIVTALIPRTLRRTELRDADELFDALDAAMDTIVRALRRGDRARAERGLERARSLQTYVDAWSGSLESGREVARISPFLRRQRTELDRHERVRGALDLTTRNLRVVARRAAYLCADGQSRPVPADLLAELARGAGLVRDGLDDISLEPVAREAIGAVARRLDPAALLPDGRVGELNLIAALRPLAVDLLVAAGMPSDDARELLPRV
ncbi:FUSC family protein [Microbacterium testaceum]|uniref:FUSC family protein n=1 Tax=Microbacterium testaceum TaxID=2033 RepID=UPI002AC7D011|nr:FUSC family protein [Microbacterium testaceum]MDZ5144512.1 FUSC family protein [Microbacterium testaceum]